MLLELLTLFKHLDLRIATEGRAIVN